MKGYQDTKTKAQNLTEIVQSQNGFLSGLNADDPKSKVGDTQVTVLENIIPYRNRLEGRGGIKPNKSYYNAESYGYGVVNNSFVDRIYDHGNTFYDEEWDVIFHGLSPKISNGKTLTWCYDYDPTLWIDTLTYKRTNDGIIVSTNPEIAGNKKIAIIRKYGNSFFIRPLVSNTTTNGSGTVFLTGESGSFYYPFVFSYVRKVNDIVEAESEINIIPSGSYYSSSELNGSNTPFYINSFVSNAYPTEYFESWDSEINFYTHIRIYRAPLMPLGETESKYVRNTNYYHVGDLPFTSIVGLSYPPVTALPDKFDMNITDSELVNREPAWNIKWRDAFEPIDSLKIFDISSAMLVARNENKKDDYIYSPIMSGDNQKYMGWYNPLFQYGSGISGKITSITDVGSYCVITTDNKTYYIDTITKTQDTDNQALGIYIPILSDAVKVDDTVGVKENQRLALIKLSEGKLIGFTSEGEIRKFSGYAWESDLARGKVQSITKGLISRNSLPCTGIFSNDSYYLFYHELDSSVTNSSVVNTLRLGTTEESGYGFTIFTGKPDSDTYYY